MVSTYDTLKFSFFLNSLPRQYFGRPKLYDTYYNTNTMASLNMNQNAPTHEQLLR
jgi:hypothetical protein